MLPATLALVGLFAFAAPAFGQAVMRTADLSSGGGHSYASGLWLTAAFGQPACGPAAGGGRTEVAGWLRLPNQENVDVPLALPDAKRLSLDVRPNPIAGHATVSFSLPNGRPAQVGMYDVAGRLVRELVAGQHTAGDHTLRWDGRDASGASLPAGVYLCRLRVGAETLVRRVVLIP